MKKLYALITKERPESIMPRTTTAIYTNRKKAEDMLSIMKDKHPEIIWDIEEWRETLTGEYVPQDIQQ